MPTLLSPVTEANSGTAAAPVAARIHFGRAVHTYSKTPIQRLSSDARDNAGGH